MGRPAHVLLHQPHGRAGLQVQPAGVEANALADQRHFRCVRLAPGQVDQPGRVVAGPADGVDGREILLQQCVAHGLVHLGAEVAGQRAGGGGQGFRPHVVGRRVDQVAHQANGGDAGQGGVAVQPSRRDQHPGAGGVVGGVAVEAVLGQAPAQRGVPRGRAGGVVGQPVAAGRQLVGQRRIGPRVRLGHLAARAQTHQGGGRRPARAWHQHHLALLGFKADRFGPGGLPRLGGLGPRGPAVGGQAVDGDGAVSVFASVFFWDKQVLGVGGHGRGLLDRTARQPPSPSGRHARWQGVAAPIASARPLAYRAGEQGASHQ